MVVAVARLARAAERQARDEELDEDVVLDEAARARALKDCVRRRCVEDVVSELFGPQAYLLRRTPCSTARALVVAPARVLELEREEKTHCTASSCRSG